MIRSEFPMNYLRTRLPEFRFSILMFSVFFFVFAICPSNASAEDSDGPTVQFETNITIIVPDPEVERVIDLWSLEHFANGWLTTCAKRELNRVRHPPAKISEVVTSLVILLDIEHQDPYAEINIRELDASGALDPSIGRCIEQRFESLRIQLDMGARDQFQTVLQIEVEYSLTNWPPSIDLELDVSLYEGDVDLDELSELIHSGEDLLTYCLTAKSKLDSPDNPQTVRLSIEEKTGRVTRTRLLATPFYRMREFGAYEYLPSAADDCVMYFLSSLELTPREEKEASGVAHVDVQLRFHR
jgi:hypothetical protein